MKHIRIEKTDVGFALRHSTFSQVMSGLLLALMLALAAVPWVVFGFNGIPQSTGTLWLAAACSIGLAGIGGWLFYTAFICRPKPGRDTGRTALPCPSTLTKSKRFAKRDYMISLYHTAPRRAKNSRRILIKNRCCAQRFFI